jgi:hypothetical protein
MGIVSPFVPVDRAEFPVVGDIEDIPIRLERRPLSAIQRRQLTGRVARQRTGRTIWIRDASEIGDEPFFLSLRSYLSLTGEVRVNTLLYFNVYGIDPLVTGVFNGLYIARPWDLDVDETALGALIIALFASGVHPDQIRIILSLRRGIMPPELRDIFDEALRMIPPGLVYVHQPVTIVRALNAFRRHWVVHLFGQNRVGILPMTVPTGIVWLRFA